MKKLNEIFSNKKTYWLLGIFVAGVVFWVGFTSAVHYMDKPEFCGTCHIMDDVVDSHAASAHADLECGSCHVPAGNIATKLMYKAKVGTGHVYYTLFAPDDIPNLLKAKQETKDVVEANCVSCHKAMLGNIEHTAKEDCESCHRGLPHGQQSFKSKDWYEVPKSGELLKNKEGVF